MKQKLIGFLRKRSVKRGIRVALCLLLALLAAASDALPILPLTGAEAANDDTADKALRDHTLYKWRRVTDNADLTEWEWTPILISYQWTFENKNGTKTTKEYFLKTNGNYLTSDYYIKATEWGPIAEAHNYPSLNGGIGDKFDKAQNTFWTVDDPLTDLYVYFYADRDVEYDELWVYELGRNIDWSRATEEDAAGEYLVCNGAANVNFGKRDSDRYKKGKDWREHSFNTFLFVGEDNHPIWNSNDRPDINLKKGEFRIYAEHDNNPDSCLYPYEDYFYFGSFGSFDYNGKFSVWIAERINLPTFEAVNAVKNGRISCTDSLQDLNRFTADATVKNGQLFKISDDVRIASNAVLLIEPGGTVTIDATLYNDGLIINYGTIFIREGGCIRPCDPYSKLQTSINGNVSTTAGYDNGLGRLICSGKYNGKLTGEGNLVMFQQSAVVFNYIVESGQVGGSNMFIVRDGASVELNGLIFSPHFIQLTDSDFHIRAKGKLVCQYYLNNRFTETKFFSTEYDESKISTSAVNKEKVPVPVYEAGSYQFINDGSFKKLTDPSTKLPNGQSVEAFNRDVGCIDTYTKTLIL